MRIIGIDPGVATTGWAILDIQTANSADSADVVNALAETKKHINPEPESNKLQKSLVKDYLDKNSRGVVSYGANLLKLVDFGIIETDKNIPLPQRLDEISVDLREILKKYEPQMAGVESLLFYNNAKTAISVGEARGIVLLELHRFGLSIKEMTPLQVKNTICGYGKAEKKQVQNNIMRICNLTTLPKPDDAADAVAIAIGSFYM